MTSPAETFPTAKDPVCGMTVKIKPGVLTSAFEGQTYHFCNPKCVAKFEAEPR